MKFAYVAGDININIFNANYLLKKSEVFTVNLKSRPYVC